MKAVCLKVLTLSRLQVPPVKELRKLIRIQALRCHVIHCQNGSKINVIPLLASRSQALRYKFLIYEWVLCQECWILLILFSLFRFLM